MQSNNDRWFTPGHILQGVRDLIKVIDLDPASEEEANKLVRAKNYFTIEDDGLTKDWYGNVFVNPPYTRGQMKAWLKKIEDQWKSNDQIDQIVALVNRSDGEWYYQFLDQTQASGYYQFRKRIKFYSPDNEGQSPRYSNDLIYWGEYPICFNNVCEKYWGDPCPSSYYNFGGKREHWRS